MRILPKQQQEGLRSYNSSARLRSSSLVDRRGLTGNCIQGIDRRDMPLLITVQSQAFFLLFILLHDGITPCKGIKLAEFASFYNFCSYDSLKGLPEDARTGNISTKATQQSKQREKTSLTWSDKSNMLTLRMPGVVREQKPSDSLCLIHYRGALISSYAHSQGS